MNAKQRALILSSVLERITTGDLARHGYARRADFKATGLHSSEASSFDLAGSLFIACEQNDEANREALFAELWHDVRRAANKVDGKDATFCQWLDRKSKEWHVALLGEMLGIEAHKVDNIQDYL